VKKDQLSDIAAESVSNGAKSVNPTTLICDSVVSIVYAVVFLKLSVVNVSTGVLQNPIKSPFCVAGTAVVVPKRAVRMEASNEAVDFACQEHESVDDAPQNKRPATASNCPTRLQTPARHSELDLQIFVRYGSIKLLHPSPFHMMSMLGIPYGLLGH